MRESSESGESLELCAPSTQSAASNPLVEGSLPFVAAATPPAGSMNCRFFEFFSFDYAEA
jgi:hypothetical protein